MPGDTNNKEDIFVRDLSTNTTTRLSVDSAGNQGNNDSEFPSISANGQKVAFSSFASNLVPGDTNNVFVLGAGLGVDTISDFANSQDTFQLINGLTFGQLSISAGTNGTLIRVASSNEVLAALTGIAPNLIGIEDFVSV